MQKNTDFSERIMQVIDFVGDTKNEFAKKLGYERSQSIYDIVNGKSKPSFDFFEKLLNSEYSEIVNIEYIISGKGNLDKTKSKENLIKENDKINDKENDKKPNVQKNLSNEKTKSEEKVIKENDNLNDNIFDNKPNVQKKLSNEYKDIQENYPIINHNRMPSVITISEKDEEKENIEIVPAKLAAGYVGGGYAEESFVLDLPKFRLPYLNNGTFRCFGVMGHSMEKIQDEDWFVGKFVDNIRNFNEGKIHAVIAPKAESLLIKRVFRHPKKMDTLILRSDSNNESNLYPDIHMPISLIAEMWSYTALISFKEPLFDVMRFKEISKTSPDFIDVKDYFSE